MDQAMMSRNARDLFALSKEFGPERVKIPSNMAEGMAFIKKFSFKIKNAFDFDDPEVVDNARRLAETHDSVFIIVNAASQKTELYVP